MIEKIKTAFPQCVANNCLDSDSRSAFYVVDSEQKSEIYKGDTTELKHPFLTIENNTGEAVNLLSIDHCVFGDKDPENCDCAVFDNKKFYFVEIKAAGNKNKRQQRGKAAYQLKNTILRFRENIDFSDFRVEAVLCVGHKQPKPAATASSAKLKAELIEKPCNAFLLNGSKIVFEEQVNE